MSLPGFCPVSSLRSGLVGQPSPRRPARSNLLTAAVIPAPQSSLKKAGGHLPLGPTQVTWGQCWAVHFSLLIYCKIKFWSYN